MGRYLGNGQYAVTSLFCESEQQNVPEENSSKEKENRQKEQFDTPVQTSSKIDELLLGMPISDLPRVSLDGAEIVRRQYLSHIKEAMVTIRPDGITFNNSCIAKMLDTYYIHLFIDRSAKRLIIRSCSENDKDGQKWCNVKNGVRKSRKITGKPFSSRLYFMMGWSKGFYYKVCGSPALQEETDDELLFVFELEEAECFSLSSKARKAAGVNDEDLSEEERRILEEDEEKRLLGKANGKATAQKASRYPKEWGNEEFGPLASDHVNQVVLPRLSELENLSADEAPYTDAF